MVAAAVADLTASGGLSRLAVSRRGMFIDLGDTDG